MSPIIILLAVTYSVLLHDTDTVMDDFKNCMKGNVTSDTIKDTELYRYYNRGELCSSNISKANINAKRMLVLHNFHKGIMLIKYDCEIFNKKGEIIYGSSNIDAKWYIEKKNNRWEVVDVFEAP